MGAAPPHLQAVCGRLQLPYQGQELDFEAPFRRATMHDLVKDACGVDFGQLGGDVEVGRAHRVREGGDGRRRWGWWWWAAVGWGEGCDI